MTIEQTKKPILLYESKWFIPNPELWIVNEMPIYEAIQKGFICKGIFVKWATKVDVSEQPDEDYLYDFPNHIVTKIFKNGSVNLQNLDDQSSIHVKRNWKFKIIRCEKIVFI